MLVVTFHNFSKTTKAKVIVCKSLKSQQSQLPPFRGKSLHCNAPVFYEMIQKRNTASKEAAWDALDMGANDMDGRLRAFDVSLLNEPWVEIEAEPGRKLKVLWHTH